ncbi:MAG: phospho-sugar mutase [Clostridiales bacterium]|nr:phospho-sugar mutase [Clostridiales bacterium]
MNDINALYDEWLCKATKDPDLIEELRSISGNESEILDRFYKPLEFGTAGLRGVIGAGTNRMNYYTVCQATQGLADFLNKHFENPSVAIGYDSRIKSEYFSKAAAQVLAANNIKVYIFDELQPTPCLSFAVRRFKTSSGIIITASHNPSKYNGFKCYDQNGYQMTDDEAFEVQSFIKKTDCFKDIKSIDFAKAQSAGLIEYMGKDVIDEFLLEVEKQRINPAACAAAGLSVIYTPLNGTGNKPVRAILERCGVKKLAVVPQQEMPDGNFPTCPYPNPEIRQAFECALKLAENEKADILLATDPDCDRVGIAVLDKNGEYTLMSGNEVGVILLNYILSERKKAGTLPQNAIAVKSFVSTALAEKIAAKYNCRFKNLLTGFKYIGELITKLEAQGRADEFIMGFEESYGYLAGTHARDKDAVVAAMLICETAAFYKLQGKNLIEVMNEIYAEFGYYKNSVKSYEFEGAAGMKKMESIMNSLRDSAPQQLAKSQIIKIDDYKTSISKDLISGSETEIDLPKSNVLSYEAENGCTLIIRPSGTEPKIKAYVTAVGSSAAQSASIAEVLTNEADALMDSRG